MKRFAVLSVVPIALLLGYCAADGSPAQKASSAGPMTAEQKVDALGDRVVRLSKAIREAAERRDALVDARLLALTKRVEQLEKKVAKLEGGPAIDTRVSAVPVGKAAWRQLKLGMSQDEVRKLLGEPMKVSAGPIIHWYYASKGSGGPKVQFSSYTGKLMGWDEPD
ncbi:MAG TPA: outer membrane protein assembly factor BamE [Phycisphaerae bacterium]|nr:outer membrane protein assembly factor BamE [Phycisphaerae bacterium]